MSATADKGPTAGELTIDELARETGMTARNIRAHQSRGLLPPPEVRSRTGYYGPEHVNRIRLIQEMQGQGFNLQAIKRMLEIGAGASEAALDFERALLAPFGEETPEVVTADDLAEMVTAGEPDGKLLAKAEKLGLIVPLGDGTWEVPSPTLFRAARELVELGIPLNHGLAVAESVIKHTGAIAKEFVRLFTQDVLEPLQKGVGDPEPNLEKANEALRRLRPLASDAVLAGFALVMTEAVERQVARELS